MKAPVHEKGADMATFSPSNALKQHVHGCWAPKAIPGNPSFFLLFLLLVFFFSSSEEEGKQGKSSHSTTWSACLTYYFRYVMKRRTLHRHHPELRTCLLKWNLLCCSLQVQKEHLVYMNIGEGRVSVQGNMWHHDTVFIMLCLLLIVILGGEGKGFPRTCNVARAIFLIFFLFTRKQVLNHWKSFFALLFNH